MFATRIPDRTADFNRVGWNRAHQPDELILRKSEWVARESNPEPTD